MGTLAGSAEKLAPRCGAWRLVERVGEGATAVVWLARHSQTGRRAALKRAKDGAEGAAAALLREAQVLARIGRRWGPALLDVGPGFLVTDWVDGVPVPVRLSAASGVERERLAAVVAHSVARALEELHQAGIHHGDVKAANVLCASKAPERDAADDRGATLIDLGLAGDLASGALGGTPRYAAPELRERGEAGPAADLWALGVLLAEILDPAVERSANPCAAVAAWSSGANEPARWVQALLAPAPGGRPSAQWVARRAARRLELRADEREAGQARVDRVRRAYLAQRAGEIGAALSPAIGEPARTWIEEAAGAARGFASSTAATARDPAAAGVIEPLGAVRRSRWLVALVGASAAAWPLGIEDAGERALVARVVELARAREPASWTLEDVLGRGEARALEWRVADGQERTSRLVRELARPVPNVEALAFAEDDVARALATPTLAMQLAGALARAGETGRAWVALMGVEGAEVDALRAEISRRRGDDDEARRAAGRAVAADDGEWASSARATLARLAWDAADLDAADRLLEGTRGAPAAAVRALVALRRGAHDAGLRVVERALAESVDPEAQSRLEAVRGLLELGRGGHVPALAAFGRAVELATRAGAVVDEATYLISEAAAATDAGDLSRALASATRAALLWERLGRPERAARAWLARAGALATLGAVHATDEAAGEARARGLESRDAGAVAYARWAQVEVRAPGDSAARAWAVEASELLQGQGSEDTLRAAGRRLVWAPETVDDRVISRGDVEVVTAGATARWEWWGFRARAFLAGRRHHNDGAVLGALLSLVDVPAPLWSRGPTLDAAVRLATDAGDGDAARRFELARAVAARALHDGTPVELRASLSSVAWARATPVGAADVAFAPAQVLAARGHRPGAVRARRPAPPARAGARHAGALDGGRARAPAPASPRRAPRSSRGPQPRSTRSRGRAARALADDRPPRDRDGRRGRRDRRAIDPGRRARERPRAALA